MHFIHIHYTFKKKKKTQGTVIYKHHYGEISLNRCVKSFSSNSSANCCFQLIFMKTSDQFLMDAAPSTVRDLKKAIKNDIDCH